MKNGKLSNVKLSEVLNLYIGCRIRATWPDGDIAEFINESIFGSHFLFGTDLLANPGTNADIEIDFVKDKHIKIQLFLIDPTELTDTQQNEYKVLCHNNYFKEQDITWETDTPESLLWLFKNKIDAFDLIYRGLAIKIPQEVAKSTAWYPKKIKTKKVSLSDRACIKAPEVIRKVKAVEEPKAIEPKIEVKAPVIRIPDYTPPKKRVVKEEHKKIEFTALEKLDKLYKDKEAQQHDSGTFSL